MQTETSIHEVSASPNLQESYANLWRRVFGIGIITIALGIAAIILPFVATLTINMLLGIILVTVGVIHAVHAFSCRHSKEILLRIMAGAAYAAVGVLFLVFPQQGVLTLTILMAALFMVMGALKIALALHVQPLPGWGWLMLSGIVAAVLGVLIWAGLPGAASWVLGLLVGIELSLTGWTIVFSALVMRSKQQTNEEDKELLS